MSNAARDLYLDLLIKVLANTIYEDPSTNPENAGPFQSELRLEGRDWPAVAHTMIGVQRLQNVRELGQTVIDEGIPGDFIEAGVWRGGSCILMRGILSANAIKDRKVYAIDSFEGLPPPKPDLFPQDEGLNLHLYSELAVSLEQVKANFARYGLLDEQVIFVKGLFQDTLPSLDAGPFALIRLDGDLYESTYVALEALYPKLSPGGFIILDDYKLLPTVSAAVLDYRSRMGIESPMHDIDWNAVWWQKPREETAPPVTKSLLKRVIFRGITLIPLFSILAVVLYFLFLTNLPQLLYANSIRNIYFDCMEFSSGSFVYKLRPGQCRVKNLEYDIVLSSDANGFRNGIRKENSYDVAVIGDSFAHGVGVADDQTFSYLLDSTYHYKTTNLAIGSYATMRELEVLGEYGKDAKYVVVQYCDNDLYENLASLKLNKEDFRSAVETEWRNRIATYHQGKSLGYAKPIRDLAVTIRNHSYTSKSNWRSWAKSRRPMEQEASAFAQILARYRPVLEGKRVIVFETASWGANSPGFESTFGSELNKMGWLNYKLINTADTLSYEDYFFLDDHITARGHRKLAAVIARVITEWERIGPLIGDH